MTRLSDAILNGAYASGKAPMFDLRYGGMGGYSPNLTEWVSNQAYIRRNLVCLLIEAPKGFQYLPNPDFWVGALKAMVELHPKSIEGFNAGLEVDWTETDVGGGGEKMQDPTNVTRARTEPVFTLVDKYGRPMQHLLHEWITMLIMDPDTKVPGIATIGNDLRPKDLAADMYGATMLFFEPDPSHTSVTKAWLTTNMYPKGTGDITGKRDLQSAGEQAELSITFAGVSQTGQGVRDFAQRILDTINMTNANPYLRPAFVQEISPDVVRADKGYENNVTSLGATAVARS